MDFEILYSTGADTVETGDVIGFGDLRDLIMEVETVVDDNDVIRVTGIMLNTGDRDTVDLHPAQTVDILGN